MTPSPIRILFMAPVDSDNTNAQSLNAREIALRLDPQRFATTLFYEREPDVRLLNSPSIRLLRLPTRRRTLAILKEMFSGHRLITYVDYSPASYLFLHSPRMLRRSARTVLHVEAPVGQLAGATRLMRFLHRSIIPRCDFHIGISDFVSRDMQRQGMQSDWILPVGVETKRFTPPPARHATIPTVLFAGSVIERKGVHLVVDVARVIPDAHFLIVGSARNRFDEVVGHRIQELGLTNVEMLGSQSQARMAEIMQSSDIFLLPSRLEGIPKVTLEAAATGLPCIVFNSYETPSVVDGLTGFQVATFEEMVDRLKLLVREPARRLEMGAHAIRHAQKFDWDIVAARWQEVYLKIAESQPIAATA